MAEITAALDEQGANKLLDAAIAAIPTQTRNGSTSLGPFTAGYAVKATLTNGTVDLIPPNVIRIADLRLDWDLSLDFSVDLGSFLPEFCLPRVCVNIPCVGYKWRDAYGGSVNGVVRVRDRDAKHRTT